MTAEECLHETKTDMMNLKWLPLCHTSMSEGVAKILKSLKLTPHKNNKPFEDQSLVFLFYGKAQFAKKTDIKDSFSPSFLPGTFLYNFSSLMGKYTPVRMIPLDSGGYELYGLSKEEIVKEFVIDRKFKTYLQKFMKIFFVSNTNYMESIISVNGKVCEQCEAFRKFVQLFKNITEGKKEVGYGHQAFTVELHFRQEIKAVLPEFVVPDIASISSEKVYLKASKLGVKFIPYNKKEDGPKTNIQKIEIMRTVVSDLVSDMINNRNNIINNKVLLWN